MTKILGIETTCDETSTAVVQDKRIVLSNIVASQAKLHSKYGGVVPEVASRKHLELLPVVTKEAFKKSNTKINELKAIAVSKEPGLPPALTVGYGFASGLALSNNLPLIEVNHLEAHISGIWLAKNKKELKKIKYPYLCLLVSGGHTEIRLVTNSSQTKIIGKTRDDAAGEAFDKIARLLDLGYPGGPVINKISRLGNESTYDFPRPMIKSNNYDFSFSGLKTAVKKKVSTIQKECNRYSEQKDLYSELCNNWKSDIAASFQEAVVDVLISKTVNAAKQLKVNIITMAGGVSANSRLRDKLGRIAYKENFDIYYPDLEYCVDNAAMVASRGFEMI